MNHILSIDLGTGGPKVALFTTRGEYVAHEFEPTPMRLLDGGGAEQDPEGWWHAITTASQRLVSKVRLNGPVVAVNVTAQWSGTVAVDKVGRALHPAITWMDSRGAKQIANLNKGLQIEGYNAFKLMKWLRLTGGGPSHSGKDPIAHILWLRDNHPEIYKSTYKFLEPKDYLNLKLTGIFAASHESIILHWVTDNRKINDIKYHDGLLKAGELDREKLPDLHKTNEILGEITPEAASQLGISADAKVVIGCPDLHSAAVGSGAVKDFHPHLYFGTSAWLVAHVPFKKTDLFHNMASLPSGIPGRYMIVNEQETAGECLDWLKENIFYNKDLLGKNEASGLPDFEEAPDEFFQYLDQIAENVEPGSGKLLFLPWLYGERSPVDDHSVRGGFYNMSLQTTRAHMIRSVMEGVAFNARWLLKYVEGMCKQEFEAVNLIGGGAKSDIWCQIVADIFNRKVNQVKDPILANARGAACLAAVAIGELTYDQIADQVEIEKTYTPNSKNREIYDLLFSQFTDYYKRNKKALSKLNH